MSVRWNKFSVVLAGALVIAGASFAFAASGGTLVTQGVDAIKAAKEQAIQDRRAAALKQVQVIPQPPSPDQEIKDRPAGTGIFENGTPPLPGATFKPTNHWAGYVNGEYRDVWAGALSDDPSQGVLIVKTMGADGAFQPLVTLKTPLRGGLVRIAQADGFKLRISADSGVRFVMDAASLQFESVTK